MTGVLQLDLDLLAAARSGDETAFEALVTPLRRELHVHSYRMLGSIDDADDALQDTFVRAWRQLATFEPRAPFRAWLYRIATNVCLTMIAKPARQREIALAALERPHAGQASGGGEPMHLEPYPDRWLDELPATISGPEATVELAESVELAFIAATQALPPRQRATILLRDVLGYPAGDVATMLETSVAGVNSALQRARTALERERNAGMVTRRHRQAASTDEDALVGRLIAAWHDADIDRIVSVLREDALLAMPPEPVRFVGRNAIGEFLATVPAGGHLERFRLVPIRANRQPSIAAYLRDDDDGPFLAHGIIVLACDCGEVASITRFIGSDLFARFDLPPVLDV